MTEEAAPPKLFEHCSRVFERMRQGAQSVDVEGQPSLVYEGFLTHLFQDLELATPYYTSVMKRLRQMNCVRQLSRGGGNAPSRWLLETEPEWDAFQAAETRKLTGHTKLGALQEQVVQMNERLLRVEEQLRLMREAS